MALSGSLFIGPRFLLHGLDISYATLPNFACEDPDENLKLAKVWDAKGFLFLAKRKIGDRRLPNARERSLDGPSRQLPLDFFSQTLGCLLQNNCCEVASPTDVISTAKQVSLMRGQLQICCLFLTATSSLMDLMLLKLRVDLRTCQNGQGAEEKRSGMVSAVPAF